MAMTLDGKVIRPDGRWYGLSSKNDKIKMDEIRSKADILITGKNSIVQDDPVVKIRYNSCKSPRVCILHNKGELPKNRNVFTDIDIKPIIFCNGENYKKTKDEFDLLADIYYKKNTNYTKPKDILEKLSLLGYKNFLLEGGPKLNYSFLKEDLVDRIYLTLVPFLIGKKNLFSICEGEKELSFFDRKKWTLKSYKAIEDEVFLIYDKKQSF